jgi:hypothetical protein
VDQDDNLKKKIARLDEADRILYEDELVPAIEQLQNLPPPTPMPEEEDFDPLDLTPEQEEEIYRRILEARRKNNGRSTK